MFDEERGLSSFSLISYAGFSLTLLLLFSVLLIPDTIRFTRDFQALIPSNFVTSLAFAAGLFVVWRLSNFVQKCKRVFVVVAFLLSLCNLPIVSQYGAFFAPHIGIGLSLSILVPLWGDFLWQTTKQDSRTALAVTLVITFVLFVILTLLLRSAVPYVIMALSMISAFLLLVMIQARRAPRVSEPPVFSAESDERMVLSWRPLILFASVCFAIGFAIYGLLSTIAMSELIYLGLGSALVAGLILYDAGKSHLINEALIGRLTLPCFVILLLPLALIQDDLRFILFFGVFLLALIPYFCSWVAIMEHIATFDLQGIRVTALANLPSALGLCLGAAVSWVAFSTEVFGEMTAAFIVILIISVNIIIFAVLVYEPKSYFPVSSTDTSNLEHDQELSPRQTYFQAKIDVLAEQYSLTKRQSEVVFFLAKGRSAKYIESTLCLSPHTVKSHIYTIYQKIGVHSKNELVTMVENIHIDRVEDGSQEIASSVHKG